MNLSKNEIEKIKQNCKKYNVKFLHLFGSTLTDEFHSESDIDFLVDFNDTSPLVYTQNYFSLKEFLQQYFSREIDLLESRALKNKILFDEINKNKLVIYEEE